MRNFTVIRSATQDDHERVAAAARRFCARHGLDLGEPMLSIYYWIASAHPEDAARHRGLWAGCLCRALRVRRCVRADIAYGNVGRWSRG